SRSTRSCSTARSWCSTTPGARASSGCRSARCSPRRATSSARCRSCPPPCSASICSDSRTGTCARSRSPSESASCACCCPTWVRCDTWITWKAAVKRCFAPCTGPIPAGRGHSWVTPRRVVEVRYREITEEGLLRAPVFLRFRDDKPAVDCARPGAEPASAERIVPREVVPSNLDKVFWPEEGYTKGDLIAYYRAI